MATTQERTKNSISREKVGVAPTVEKMVESCPRWYGSVWSRDADDQMDDNPIVKGRGRPKRNIGLRDLEVIGGVSLSSCMIHDIELSDIK